MTRECVCVCVRVCVCVGTGMVVQIAILSSSGAKGREGKGTVLLENKLQLMHKYFAVLMSMLYVCM